MGCKLSKRQAVPVEESKKRRPTDTPRPSQPPRLSKAGDVEADAGEGEAAGEAAEASAGESQQLGLPPKNSPLTKSVSEENKEFVTRVARSDTHSRGGGGNANSPKALLKKSLKTGPGPVVVD